MRNLGLPLAAGILMLSLGPHAKAQSVADFYRTHPLSIVIGFSAANAYDVYGRLLARHIAKHIPGNPTIIPINKPGAGSLSAANYLYAVAPKDGSVIGIFSRSIPVDPLLGTPGAAYDARKFTWLGSAGSEVSICVAWHTSPVKTWGDLLTKDFVVAASGPTSDTGAFPLFIKNFFGAKIKIINGYPGGGEMSKAIESGEVDGRCGWSYGAAKAAKPDWFADKKLNILVQTGLHKNPELPDVPLIIDLGTTAEQTQILKVVFSRQEFGWPFAAPPDVPEDRKLALRQAFDETLRDPEFLEDAQKIGAEINPMSGAEFEKLIADIYGTPDDVVAKVRDLTTAQ
jgi:tripartite-type tricarboxylate transporter receptor subunit TctC